MGTAGNRVHGTTHERPLTRFAEAERHFLRALPDVAPEVVTWAGVKLHGNCHVQFEKAFYSAPFQLVHQHLWLRAGEKTVQIFHGQTLVAVHSRLRRPGGKSTVNEHLPPEARAYLMQTPQWCLEHAERIGPMCRELVVMGRRCKTCIGPGRGRPAIWGSGWGFGPGPLNTAQGGEEDACLGDIRGGLRLKFN